MPVRRRVVTQNQQARAQLPEWAAEGVVLQQELVERGVWQEFGQRTKTVGRQLAALGHRRSFPTPSAVSRFLAVVEDEHTRQLASWLLLDGSGAAAVLRHPAAVHRDTHGDGWHVFDWDGTSTALRERALPQSPELPSGRRRTTNLATRGYVGRKRGEVRCSRATLQHAGTGLWVDLVLLAKRADTATALPSGT